ncbi:MAG: sensor histidine kinase, partial [Trebonia sp.]
MDIARRPRALPSPPRLLPGRLSVTDIALTVGLIAAFSEPGFDPYHHDSGTVWAAAGVLGAAALAWRRAAPRSVWLAATGTGTWLLVTRHGPDWGGLSPLVLIPTALAGLYSLASRSGRRAGQRAAVLTLAALEAGLLSHQARVEAIVTVAALTVTAWAAGESASARARALSAERSARDLRAAADERARIARELHDIVAHHVSVISLQAGTARLLAQAGTPPDTALLSGIETASRQAMAELRHALGVIRHVPGGAEPPPGLARLPELAAGTGLAVTVDGMDDQTGGPAGPLPAAIELTAYRVIQESLTNVLRHSAARAARVTLRRSDGLLRITVTDDGPPRAGLTSRGSPPGCGQGLRGLGERVAGHGGTFDAGPRAGGRAAGFAVWATLPVP